VATGDPVVVRSPPDAAAAAATEETGGDRRGAGAGAMRAWLRYTLARAGLFAAAWGLVWAVGFPWLEWDEVSALWTALLALGLSAAVSVPLLRGLRGELSEHVARRAHRVATALDDSRRSEDG